MTHSAKLQGREETVVAAPLPRTALYRQGEGEGEGGGVLYVVPVGPAKERMQDVAAEAARWVWTTGRRGGL